MDGRHVHHPKGQLLGGLRERRGVCSLCVQSQLKWICPSSLKGHIRARQQVCAQTKVTGHRQHWEPLFLETDPRRYNLLITYSDFLGRRPGYTQPSASSMGPAGVLSPSALTLSGERGVQGPPTQRTGGSRPARAGRGALVGSPHNIPSWALPRPGWGAGRVLPPRDIQTLWSRFFRGPLISLLDPGSYPVYEAALTKAVGSWLCVCVQAASVTQACPTLCDPMNCTLPGSLSMGFSRQEY